MRGRLRLSALLLALPILFLWISALPLRAADSERDFSGKWVLDQNASDTASLGQIELSLNVSQGAAGILCSAGTAQWSYALDGSETRKQFGDENRSSMTKWEGSALLVTTIVSGPRHYSIMERWQLSHTHNTLTITRQVVRADGESEGTLVFRREGVPQATPPIAQPATSAADAPPAGWRQTASADDGSQPVLAKRPEQSAAADVTVPTGTRVLLSLIGELNTKYAKEGDHVYLRTAAPVAAGGHVVIPRDSDVEGVITRAKPAGKVVGKGELYIRFDSLILPNGVSRDFRARPMGDEGKVEGGGKSADGRTVVEGAGMGATVGAITRGLGGAAVGGAAGALAGVLLSRNQNVVLKAGTHLEMVLDRDLVFRPDELP
jgi:hypothetical protein